MTMIDGGVICGYCAIGKVQTKTPPALVRGPDLHPAALRDRLPGSGDDEQILLPLVGPQGALRHEDGGMGLANGEADADEQARGEELIWVRELAAQPQAPGGAVHP